ncbi:hypothetical protein L7F22_036149 [Adiantum nelumboides]|nr:hypothetical protein [Adiantum nelumboides]
MLLTSPSRADFLSYDHADMRGADLSGKDMKGSVFAACDCRLINLEGSNLDGSMVTFAGFQGANLENTSCEEQFGEEELDNGFQGDVACYTGGDVAMASRIENVLLAFRNESNHFGRAIAKLRERQLQPVSWWEKYGNCAPTLKCLAIRVFSQDCAAGPGERNWSTWALFYTKKRNKLTTLQLGRLVFCHCNLKLLEKLSSSPEPTQVNVDKIDIEKVRDIPDIPQQERDLYALLYEEAIAPVHDTRGQRRQRGRARVAGTSAVRASASADDSFSSSSSEESEEDEAEDETQDEAQESDA